jgi:hypothetical protein
MYVTLRANGCAGRLARAAKQQLWALQATRAYTGRINTKRAHGGGKGGSIPSTELYWSSTSSQESRVDATPSPSAVPVCVRVHVAPS